MWGVGLEHTRWWCRKLALYTEDHVYILNRTNKNQKNIKNESVMRGVFGVAPQIAHSLVLGLLSQSTGEPSPGLEGSGAPDATSKCHLFWKAAALRHVSASKPPRNCAMIASPLGERGRDSTKSPSGTSSMSEDEDDGMLSASSSSSACSRPLTHCLSSEAVRKLSVENGDAPNDSTW